MSKSTMFQGYFKSFNEINKSSNIFHNKKWISREFTKIKKLKNLKSHEITLANDYPFLIATSIIYDSKKLLKIIDFGGGFGISYLQLTNGIKNLKKLKYYIVDIPEVCSVAKKNFKYNKNLFFMTKIPNIYNCDVFHYGSCLQYIDDWKMLLRKTCKLKPKYIIFSDLIAGDIKEFVTVQKFDDSKMPFRFYNIAKIINFIKKFGYKLILRNNYRVRFNGKPSDLPTKIFPKNSQLKNSSNLIFKKK